MGIAERKLRRRVVRRAKVETAGGVFQVREDEAEPRDASLER